MTVTQNHDYALGLIAGIWLAQRDETLNEAQVKQEADKFYERAATILAIERCPFVTAFQEAYSGYLDGLV
jgi:hypothetical protein